MARRQVDAARRRPARSAMPGCGHVGAGRAAGAGPSAARRADRSTSSDVEQAVVGWARGATSQGPSHWAFMAATSGPRHQPRRATRWATNQCRRPSTSTDAEVDREPAWPPPSAGGPRRPARRACGTGRRRAARAAGSARRPAGPRSTTARASASERTTTPSSGSGPGARPSLDPSRIGHGAPRRRVDGGGRPTPPVDHAADGRRVGGLSGRAVVAGRGRPRRSGAAGR